MSADSRPQTSSPPRPSSPSTPTESHLKSSLQSTYQVPRLISKAPLPVRQWIPGQHTDHDSGYMPPAANSTTATGTSTGSSLRRSRAGTMPSQSTAFPYSTGGRFHPFPPPLPTPFSTPSTMAAATTTTGTPTTVTTPPSHLCPVDLVIPPSGLRDPFSHGFLQTWSETLQSPTTPTTDQLLKGDNSNTIASTLASLGLDDERDQRHTIHTSQSIGSLRLRERVVEPATAREEEIWEEEAETDYMRPHRHSYATARLQAQAGRPRAISMSTTNDRQTASYGPTHLPQPQLPPVWGANGRLPYPQETGHRPRPFLRSSNSSADILEIMARQRASAAAGVAAATSSSSISSLKTTAATSAAMTVNATASTTTMTLPSLPATMTTPTATPPPILEETSDRESAALFSAYDAADDFFAKGSVATGQTPTRSLWLGNIDVSLTTADLTATFAPYGTIDSLRILPDRECAFVNFSTLDEALRAKDALINKLGCCLGNAVVKIGFGKPDAVPQPQPGSTEMGPNAQGPTRALWIGNIPTTTTPATLMAVFAAFGTIESVRVLSHKNCGFVNFDRLEDAVRAKKALQGRDMMGIGSGMVRIGFAKVPNRTSTILPNHPPLDESVLEDKKTGQPPQVDTQMMFHVLSEMMGGNSVNIYAAVAAERQLIMKEFDQGDDAEEDTFEDIPMPRSYYSVIPLAPELGQTRKVDIARLRDIRRRLDLGQVAAGELETIATECMDELVELCSDYIGNTVIQRLFERCSDETKSQMIHVVAPFLASIGVHKNGTWAAQKMIDTASLPSQIDIICNAIKPYVPALLLDQFGNYVVQCCLGLGPEWNQFIFDAIVDSCWEIAQGRFGARAMRATLESSRVTRQQQRYVAAAIVQHAVLLATNANGALLLIWLLDTSGIPGRYRVLAPRLVPHLPRLCTHKLASLTVLKLVNQRLEPEARKMILDALFFDKHDQTIEEVLQDQVHGVNLVQKILSSSYVELRERQSIAGRIKQLLASLKLQHVQGYKRLMEEITMVLGDADPGSILGALSGLVVPPSLAMNPSLAAALQATYMSTDKETPEIFPQLTAMYCPTSSSSAVPSVYQASTTPPSEIRPSTPTHPTVATDVDEGPPT